VAIRSFIRAELRAARGLLTIHPIELLQVLRNALLDQPHPRLHLARREVAIAVVDRLELAAVDRHRRLAEQTPTPAQHDELAADVLDRRTVLRSKVGQRLEVRGQPPYQPHQLEVATRFPLQPARGLDPVQVAVEVDLEHRCRVIARPPRVRRIHPLEPKPRQVKLRHEGVDDAHRVLLRDILIDPLREQRPLRPIALIDEPAHSSLLEKESDAILSLQQEVFTHPRPTPAAGGTRSVAA
jgi:hypothetical protein